MWKAGLCKNGKKVGKMREDHKKSVTVEQERRVE